MLEPDGSGGQPRAWRLVGRAAFTLVGLTVLFAADDWLLILLAEQLKVGPFPMLAYVGAGLGVAVTNGLLALAVYRVMKRKPVSGAEGLVGETAIALHDFRGQGLVRLHGETWTAVVSGRVRKGQRLVVEAVEGLEVHVRAQKMESGLSRGEVA